MKKLTQFIIPYRYFVFIVLMFSFLFGLRWVWFELFPIEKSFRAVDGVVDLRGLDLGDSSPLSLDGQWEWYPDRLLSRQQIRSEDHEARSIQVPGDWKAALNPDSNSSYGYGTYRLHILTDPLEQPVAFWLKGIQASSEVEVNGTVLGGAGRVASKANEYTPHNISYKLSYSGKGETEIELLVRITNYDSPYSGGILRSVRFGSQTAIDSMSWYSIGFQLMTVMIMLLHGLYACIVYLYKPKDRLLFNAGLVFLLVGLAISLLLWLPANYTWTIKIRAIVLLWQNLCILLVYRKFAGAARSRGLQTYIAVLAGLTGVILAAPASVINSLMDVYLYLAVYLISYVWFIWTVGTMAFKKQTDKDVTLLLLTAVSIMSNLAWSIVELFVDVTNVYYPIDLAVAVTAFATYWFKKYLRNSDEIGELNEKLKIADKMKDQFALSPLTRQAGLPEQEAASTIQAFVDLRVSDHEPHDWSAHGGIPSLLQDRNIHILVVDDDPINLNVLVGILSAETYHVTTACSAQEALDLLETQRWDLLIADVMMPRMSGYELTERVREHYSVSELPVLLITARSQPADIYTGFLAGANDYVTKPADALEFKYRIRALIMLKQSIHDRQRIEAAYLQAQLQPHFLFNTLNSLMVLSEIDTERMRSLGEAFASFLQVSFDYLNMGETVKLSRELELVEAYLYIEKERFRDRLSVVWEVESDIRLFLPPLSIQPLVENAVRHGLMGRVIGGTVHLRVVRQHPSILIEVKDNGIGMSPEKVMHLLNSSMKEKGGIGIANTNRRLIQLYGHGLSIDSKPGEGTTVSFAIPIK